MPDDQPEQSCDRIAPGAQGRYRPRLGERRARRAAGAESTVPAGSEMGPQADGIPPKPAVEPESACAQVEKPPSPKSIGHLLRRWKCPGQLPRHGPDSVHSWTVAGCCAMACFCSMAGRRSSGFLLVAFLDTFQVNRSEASWPVMLLSALLCLSGLVGGPLAHRFTARPVLIAGSALSSIGAMLSFFATNIDIMKITIGVIHAIGAGMVFVASPTIISEHFVKHKGLATGVYFLGATVAAFVFPKLLEYLYDQYGLHGTLLIFGGVLMNGLAFSLFPRTPEWSAGAERSASSAENDKHGTWRHGMSVFRSPILYLFMYSFIVQSFGYECYIALFIDFAVDRGATLSTAVTVYAMGAIPEAFARLLLPAAVDRGLLSNKALMVIVFAGQGLILLVLPFLYMHGLIFAASVGTACTIGAGMIVIPVTVACYFGVERMSMSYGIIVASAGMFSFGKPTVIGYFRDSRGAYDILFLICGSLTVAAALMWSLVFLLEARQERKKASKQCASAGVEITHM
ncbi:monocarboxylate transporter 2-like isoform X3 [Dermacentor albipictus]|uniref:monocarboxylate transporter 2-like isoform X3 n=1 Tax=Dermacentor albipictus TaxID=60249 RepID=UPI0038FCE1AF